jgi:hypothetical protein
MISDVGGYAMLSQWCVHMEGFSLELLGPSLYLHGGWLHGSYIAWFLECL